MLNMGTNQWHTLYNSKFHHPWIELFQKWFLSPKRENLRESRESSKHKTRSLEVEWDRQTVKNALRFKRLVETGQFIPNEILQKLEAKANRTPEEEDILKHNIEISNIKEKVRLFSY